MDQRTPKAEDFEPRLRAEPSCTIDGTALVHSMAAKDESSGHHMARALLFGQQHQQY